MSIKLTKTELRSQQTRLNQFQRYLPTLQLKKAMLQFEVMSAEMEITRLNETLDEMKKEVLTFSPFLLEPFLLENVEIEDVRKRYENIAGVEIPVLEKVRFKEPTYFIFDTPVWTERAILILQEMITTREKTAVAMEKKRALQKELRDVSIRVNLFEKILIPRSQMNIGKIRIFLGDQQLAAVAQAKVAKSKIAKVKEMAAE